MDGTTEPVIAVIGHPIAGNPSQFALERAFESMRMEWRVLSFDVAPEKMPAAMAGTDALGFRGIVLDSTVGEAASAALGCDPVERIDSVYRDADGELVGYHAERAWLVSQIQHHRSALGRDLRCLGVGDCVDFVAEPTESIEQLDCIDDPVQVEQSDLIVLSRASEDEFALDLDDWPSDDGQQTLVIDRSGGDVDLVPLAKLGYKVLTAEDCQIGQLLECFRRWTGETASSEIVRDAIEEYLAV